MRLFFQERHSYVPQYVKHVFQILFTKFTGSLVENVLIPNAWWQTGLLNTTDEFQSFQLEYFFSWAE